MLAQFNDWCEPRRGNSNPEIQTNDVWSWLVETRAWPHAAHWAAGKGKKRAPGWCFSRYGQSETHLRDGTIIYIGGEHEDHYDPDFYIYNDVVVVRPDASIEIYGYPTDLFPPTDFHSATLIGDRIYIVGGLRYPEDRNHNDTQVYFLNLCDFSIHSLATQGQPPFWLWKHSAELDDAASKIVCVGGKATHHPTKEIVENLSTWELDLETSSWTEATTKPFTRWLLMREDESYNDLWGIEQVAEASRSSRRDDYAEKYRAEFGKRGHSVDANLYDVRFSPKIPHSVVEPNPDHDDYNTHRILVDGVIVRYVENHYEIAVTVEGILSTEKLETLKSHGLETYSKLEGVPYKCVPL